MLRIHVDKLSGSPLNIGDSAGSVLGVHAHTGHNAVCPKFEFARFQRRTKSGGDRAEHGANVAPIHTIAAIMTSRTAVMSLCELCQTPMGARPPETLTRCREDGLRAVEWHGREKDSIRELRPPLRGSTNANEALYTVVVGLQIRVVEGPVHPVSVTRSSFKFVVGHAVRGTRPVQTSAAQAARSTPLVRRVGSGRVRVFLVVEHDPIISLTAAVPAE